MKRIASILLIISFVLCVSSCARRTAEPDRSLDYYGLFDTSVVHTVNVEINEDDWADLKANPLSKTKFRVSVTIDGEKVENVSFATKGNTSLSHVASSGSDRYSFKINFGKYVKGQTYHGLDKLNLNNIMADATYMKDYLSYTIMREAGVAAPLISYAALSINGELHGLYIAIENVSESFLERNYGTDDCALYKPETERLDNMDAPGGQQNAPGDITPPEGFDPQSGQFPSASFTPPEGITPPDGQFPSESFTPQEGITPPGGQGIPGGFGDNDANGADLVYKDDDPSSYSDIFDNEETDVTDEDRTELIAAIKALSDGEDIGAYWDMDQIVRYFAAHNFVLNYDSYTGTMLHNYYLCERDGKVTVFPWDYNLAFGGFTGAGNATSSVNSPIDSPLSGTTEDARPLWKAIVSNDEYLELYHSVYAELISNFFGSGNCAKEIERVKKLISPYVKNDPTAFYTFSQFKTAVSALESFVTLRSESIGKQLDGTLGSTSGTQKTEDLVDASGLDISSMGTMGGDKTPGGQGGNIPGQPGQNMPGQPGQPGQGGNMPGQPGQGGNIPGQPGQGGNMPGQPAESASP